MGKKTKIWLVIAAVLVLVGGVVFGGAMAALNWDFAKLSTNKYETNHHEVNNAFTAITINTDTADILFVPAEDGRSSVVCYELENANHSVTVKDDTLVVEITDTKKWYEHIGINFATPKITVSIPQGEYGVLSVKGSTGDVEIPEDFLFHSMNISESTGHVSSRATVIDAVRIKTTTGSIRLENISAEMLDLTASTGGVTVSNVVCAGDANIRVSTGKTHLTNLQCRNLASDGDTGDVSLEKVIAAEKISIERNTGDVKFDSCDGAEIYVETDTGDVTGSLLTDKVFIAETDTGKVNVPKTMSGGKCRLKTDTGNIKITID